jgi:hypothetical protein
MTRAPKDAPSKRASSPAKKRDRAPLTEVPKRFAPIARAFEGAPGVTLERGWDATGAVLKVGGKIFAMLVRDELVLKLSKARVDELVERGAGARFDPRGDGRLMKEWIVVAPSRASAKLAEEAHRLVSSAKR